MFSYLKKICPITWTSSRLSIFNECYQHHFGVWQVNAYSCSSKMHPNVPNHAWYRWMYSFNRFINSQTQNKLFTSLFRVWHHCYTFKLSFISSNLQKVCFGRITFSNKELSDAWHYWFQKGVRLKLNNHSLHVCQVHIMRMYHFEVIDLWTSSTFFWDAL